MDIGSCLEEVRKTSHEVVPLLWGAGIRSGHAPQAQMDTRCSGTHASHRGPAEEGSPALETHELPPRLPCRRFIRPFFFFSCAAASLQLTSRSACPSGQHRTQ